MKKFIYTLALVAMGISASYAQERGPGRQREKGTVEERAEKAANRLQTHLNLTTEQKEKIKSIEMDRIKKTDEFRQKDDSEMRDKMEKRKALLKSSNDRIDAVLTSEQRKKLEASRAELKEKMQDRRGKGQRRGSPPPPPLKG